ncbi:MAG: glycosyl transferase [Novosphingobium sp.]|nr:glycosyl transferase [Novosphingobium sp.]
MKSEASLHAGVVAIVATVNRTVPLARLLESLAGQTVVPREVIIVDQNETPLDEAFLQSAAAPLKLIHLHCPRGRGVSWARNVGWRQAEGEWAVFPDDDCWYPPDYLEKALDRAALTGAEVLCGRATDLSGRTINGRFAKLGGRIAASQVFVSQIEWNMLVRLDALHATGGYDEAISLGGATPWQGGEGYDLLLRAITLDIPCFYDPDLVAHHNELPVAHPDEAMVRKGRDYARGLGRVLGVHDFGITSVGYWVARSVANLALSLAHGRPDRARYFLHQAVGRVEGWLGTTFTIPAHRPTSRTAAQSERCRTEMPHGGETLAVAPMDRCEARVALSN